MTVPDLAYDGLSSAPPSLDVRPGQRWPWVALVVAAAFIMAGGVAFSPVVGEHQSAVLQSSTAR